MAYLESQQRTVGRAVPAVDIVNSCQSTKLAPERPCRKMCAARETSYQTSRVDGRESGRGYVRACWSEVRYRDMAQQE